MTLLNITPTELNEKHQAFRHVQGRKNVKVTIFLCKADESTEMVIFAYKNKRSISRYSELKIDTGGHLYTSEYIIRLTTDHMGLIRGTN